MTSLAFGKGTYRRLVSGLPELRLVNMFVEAAATSQDGIVLLPRPGLTAFATKGQGPIRGLFSQAGTLNDQLFALSGSSLFGDGELGPVAGNGAASFAASATELIVTAGAGISRTDGTLFNPVLFPDDASVVAVAYVGGYFVAVRSGSQRFYWSALRDASAWDGLDYASAESSPDPLRDLVVVGDVMWLLGASTIEPWTLTGDANLPFSRVEGRNYQRGVIATGCAVELDNTLFWIGDDGRVYRAGAAPEGMSDPGVEERIAASESVAAFAWEHEGHKFFCVRLDSETLAFDVATGEWCEFASYGRQNWRVRCVASVGGRAVLGDDVTGAIWRADAANYTDAGSPLSRLLTAFQPVSDGSFTLDVVHLDADFGSTPVLAGAGSDPIVELRTSRDGGRTWGPWRASGLGRQGQYRARAVWRRFGSFEAPGGLFEFRCTDPVRLRISAVRANETQGGRSR
jgi:hypothetical protein